MRFMNRCWNNRVARAFLTNDQLAGKLTINLAYDEGFQ